MLWWGNALNGLIQRGLDPITENKTSLGNSESMFMFLLLGWTETLSKTAGRSWVLAGAAAGVLVVWEHVLKAQLEGKAETRPAAALALLWCGSREEQHLL